MNGIPEDIMQAARDIMFSLDTTAYGAIIGTPQECAGDIDKIARAILAERQACEKVARDRADKWRMTSPSRVYEANYIAEAISERSS